MELLIDLKKEPVAGVLKELLKDRTTGQNIILATNAYAGYDEKKQITTDMILGFDPFVIQPRVLKSQEQQLARTRNKAEVFTPSWICNKMNNHCDTEWFGRESVFNVEDGQAWNTVEEIIEFPKGKTWKEYIDSRRLEITCGEAPYIVSRYDASTGEIIPIKDRIGILDRKLRIVNENTEDEKEWIKWAYRAFQSVYGYEFQGDSLLIARINLLITFADYMQDRWRRYPNDKEIKKVVDIIVWNLWQMDGITGTIPFGKPKEEYHQISLFDFMQGINDTEEKTMDCMIYDWRGNCSITFNSMKRGVNDNLQ